MKSFAVASGYKIWIWCGAMQARWRAPDAWAETELLVAPRLGLESTDPPR